MTYSNTVVAALIVGTGAIIARGTSAPAAAVPVGTAFTYQGSLTQGELPANGAFDFQFILFDASTLGNQVGGPVVVEDVVVTDGIFTVLIDFGPGAFGGDGRWLDIGVRPGVDTGLFTILIPRHELTSTPYAIWASSAANADLAQSAPWSGVTGVPGDIADGDDDTQYTASTGLSLNGTEFTVAVSYQLPQACSGGQVAKWNGAAWVCADDTDTNTQLSEGDVETLVTNGALDLAVGTSLGGRPISTGPHTVDTDTVLDLGGVQALGFVAGPHTVDTDTVLDLGGVQALGFVAGPHTVDTDTVLDLGGVQALGFVAGPHTVDTDTVLDLGGVQALGFVAGPHTVDTDTVLDLGGVQALGFVAGPHTVDTDTVLDLGGIQALGFVAGPHTVDTDTTLDQAGVVALGFAMGPHTVDTTLDQAGVAALGFATGPHTQNIWSQNGSDIFYNGGKVGIGTNTPFEELDVSSTSNPGISITSTSPGAAQWSLYTIGSDPSRLGFFEIQRTSGTDTIPFTIEPEAPSYTMYLDGSGSVGIGTPSPSAGAKLQVEGAIRVPVGNGTVLYGDPNASGTPGTDSFRVRYEQDFFGSFIDALVFEKTDVNDLNPDGGIAFVNTGLDGVAETALSIRGSGNVGIGTTSPAERLEVSGNIRLSNVGGGGTRSISLPQTTTGNNGNLLIQAGGVTTNSGTAFQGGNLVLRAGNLNTAGGAWAGSGTVEIHAGKNQYKSTVNGDIKFFAGDSDQERMRIVGDSGNVGIGTASPGAKLSFNNLNDGSNGADGITWYNPSPTAYGIYRTPGVWSGPDYQQLSLTWQTGIRLDPGTAHGKSYVDIGGGGLRVTAGNAAIGTTGPGLSFARDKDGVCELAGAIHERLGKRLPEPPNRLWHAHQHGPDQQQR